MFNSKFFLLMLLLLVAFASNSYAGDIFYQWTTDNGIVEMTDDPDRIPAKYKSRAAQRTWSELVTKVPFTQVVTPAEEMLTKYHSGGPMAIPLVSKEICGAPYRVTQVRRDVVKSGQRINTTMYITTNSCGTEIGISFRFPRSYIGI